MKWISVKERLPKNYQRVLATDGVEFDFAHVSNEFNLSDEPTGFKFWNSEILNGHLRVNPKKITHWMEVRLPSQEKKIGR